MKKKVIALIHLYQRKGPKSLHEACRFEPTCSNYMLLAIEKYGTLKGVAKGIIVGIGMFCYVRA